MPDRPPVRGGGVPGRDRDVADPRAFRRASTTSAGGSLLARALLWIGDVCRPRSRSFFFCVGVLPLALAACPASDDASVDTDAPTTAAPGTGTEATGTDTEATSSETEDDPTGGELPAACTMPDPAVNAAFAVDLGDWPVENPDAIELRDVACTITDVQSADGNVATTLECEDPDAAMHAIAIEIPQTDAGAPTWLGGEGVVMTYLAVRDTELDTGEFHWLSLHRDTGELLLGAVDSDLLVGSGDVLLTPPVDGLAPLSLELDEGVCGYTGGVDDDVASHGVIFGLGEDELELIGGQRGLLQSGELAYAIDLAVSEIGHCCHSLRNYELVLRSVSP